MNIVFGNRNSVEEVEEGDKLQPKFDEKGLIPAITVDISSKEILMHGYMNKEALKLSIETKMLIIGQEVDNQFGKKVKKADLNKELKK